MLMHESIPLYGKQIKKWEWVMVINSKMLLFSFHDHHSYYNLLFCLKCWKTLYWSSFRLTVAFTGSFQITIQPHFHLTDTKNAEMFYLKLIVPVNNSWWQWYSIPHWFLTFTFVCINVITGFCNGCYYVCEFSFANKLVDFIIVFFFKFVIKSWVIFYFTWNIVNLFEQEKAQRPVKHRSWSKAF